MASTSSDLSATPVSIICSVCVESLTDDGSDVVTTNCGHAFHKKCLYDWYVRDESKSKKQFRCPKCNKITKTDCTRDLYLDAEDNTEYVDVVKRLQEEKAEAMEMLCQKDVEMAKLRKEHDETVGRLYRENAEQMERLRLANDESMERIRLEQSQMEIISQEMKKQITVNKIKSILFGPNNDLIDEQFGDLKWDDLTLSFQTELWEKVPARFHSLQLNKSTSLSSNTIICLIKSASNDEALLLKLMEDFFHQQVKLNGSLSWTDFTKLFKQDLLPWLREKFERPSLKLEELPLTPKIIATLLEAEEDDTKRGVSLVARIVEQFIENFSDEEFMYICGRLYEETICSLLPKKIGITFSMGLEEELRLGSAVNDYFIAMVIRRNFPKQQRFCYKISGDENEEPWTNYFLKYFYNGPSEFSLKLINLTDVETLDFFTIYLLLISDTFLKDFMAQQASAYQSHFLKMEWLCEIKCVPINMSILHFAAIKGDFSSVGYLLINMDFSRVLGHSRFKNLIHLCAMETLYESHEQIEERKKIIKTFLNCSKNVAAAENIRLNNVHIDLLKFIVERGPEVHEKIWSEKQMLLEAGEYLQSDHFHDLANWLVENGHSEMLRKRDAAGASPLDLAIQRVNIKPETIQLFLDAGVTLNTEIRKKMMDI